MNNAAPSSAMHSSANVADSVAVDALIQRVCQMIAPSWPLDQLIAVNPLWKMVDSPIEDVSASMATRQNARLLMDRSYFRWLWNQKHVAEADLQEAAQSQGVNRTTAELVDHLGQDRKQQPMRSLVAVLDAREPQTHHQPWQELVTDQISQFCGAWFDRGSAQWPITGKATLFEDWHHNVVHERGLSLITGERKLHRAFLDIPDTPAEVVAQTLAELAIPTHIQEAYLHHLLLWMQGWASHCVWRQWQPNETDPDYTPDLLAMRAAWDLVLFRLHRDRALQRDWDAELESWDQLEARHRREQTIDWVWQNASEIAYQRALARFLPAWGCHHVETEIDPVDQVEAVFCIDVRSEVLRRHLEAVSSAVKTRGFAGFFGIPATRRVPGLSGEQPHLPGLIRPLYRIQHDDRSGNDAVDNQLTVEWHTHWKSFSLAPPALFGYVESAGWLHGLKLLAGKVGSVAKKPALNGIHGHGEPFGRPRLYRIEDNQRADTTAQAEVAFNALKGMDLIGTQSGLVLLAAHKSPTTNNPYATSLHCGACCGQNGSTNARTLAAILNDPEVRSCLSDWGCGIAAHTHFLPAVHNTVTDELTLLDTDAVPASHHAKLQALSAIIEEASSRTREERAERFNLSSKRGNALLRHLERRGNDWSQIRPEWGLAGNASLIVGPRERSGHLKLGGRTFLHDYNWRRDEDLSGLEQVMNAPMVVSHWINFQYYASTTDNGHYGSGNKVLHNVVGGHVGVFEGNNGDLRIGLPIQSLHDGEGWVHQPLRLSVFIDAPARAIDAVLARSPVPESLVRNGWVHLFRIDDETRAIEKRDRDGHWHPFPES